MKLATNKVKYWCFHCGNLPGVLSLDKYDESTGLATPRRLNAGKVFTLVLSVGDSEGTAGLYRRYLNH